MSFEFKDLKFDELIDLKIYHIMLLTTANYSFLILLRTDFHSGTILPYLASRILQEPSFSR